MPEASQLAKKQFSRSERRLLRVCLNGVDALHAVLHSVHINHDVRLGALIVNLAGSRTYESLALKLECPLLRTCNQHSVRVFYANVNPYRALRRKVVFNQAQTSLELRHPAAAVRNLSGSVVGRK